MFKSLRSFLFFCFSPRRLFYKYRAGGYFNGYLCNLMLGFLSFGKYVNFGFWSARRYTCTHHEHVAEHKPANTYDSIQHGTNVYI